MSSNLSTVDQFAPSFGCILKADNVIRYTALTNQHKISYVGSYKVKEDESLSNFQWIVGYPIRVW
jgi:hypothetical protein